MVENNLNSLAETLAKTGLASSTSQAMMMAQNIMGTEKRVAQHFDGKTNEIDKDLSRKRTYDEEIQDLIQKTSPEKKDFHYMVSGYKKDEEKKPELKIEEEVVNELEEPVEIKEPVQTEPSVSDILESAKTQVQEVQEEVSISVEEIQPSESIEPVSPTQIQTPFTEHVQIPSQPVFQNQAVVDAVNSAKPVFTNNPDLDDDRMLKDIMDEQAREIYSNNSISQPVQESVVESEVSQVQEVEKERNSVPEYTVVNFEAESSVENLEPIQESIVSNQPENNEEFIVPVQEELMSNAPVQEQLVPVAQEPLVEEEKVFKNPIEKVDLMAHFKFG